MRLKEIRKQRGVTQLKLAMDLNISQNTISRYETGEREADYTTLIRLADYFNVSLDYLLERTDDPTFHKKYNSHSPAVLYGLECEFLFCIFYFP